jgi:uncharacterized coiled-coil protein SlyX
LIVKKPSRAELEARIASQQIVIENLEYTMRCERDRVSKLELVRKAAVPEVYKEFLASAQSTEDARPVFRSWSTKARVEDNGDLSISTDSAARVAVAVRADDVPEFVRWCAELCGKEIPERKVYVTKPTFSFKALFWGMAIATIGATLLRYLS